MCQVIRKTQMILSTEKKQFYFLLINTFASSLSYYWLLFWRQKNKRWKKPSESDKEIDWLGEEVKKRRGGKFSDQEITKKEENISLFFFTRFGERLAKIREDKTEKRLFKICLKHNISVILNCLQTFSS